MSVKKDDGRWLVDIRSSGACGKRVRKRFDTKAEALRFKAWIISQATQGTSHPRFDTHIRQLFYDQWRQHPDPATHPWTRQHYHDHEVCASCARSP